MLIKFPSKKGIHFGDLIVLTSSDRFIGYGKVTALKDDLIFVEADFSASRVIEKLSTKKISYHTELD